MAKSAAATVSEQTFGARLKSWPQRTMDFLRDVRTEMRHVTTPSRKEVQSTTVVVIICVFLFAAFFWIVDMAIGRGIDSLLKYFIHR